MRGGLELRVAAAAAPPAGDDDLLVCAREVVHLLAGIRVIDDRSYRDFQHHTFAIASRLVRSLAVAPALSFVFGIEAEVDEGVVALARFHHHITAPSAIAAGRA